MDPKEIDKENLIETIRQAPEQLTAGLELSKDLKLDKKYNSVVLSGMGGSALVAELLNIYLDKFQIEINRSYSLPQKSYDPDCLNIISSYSGNTEETLSCFEEALKNNLSCLGIASSGRVEEICREKKIPFIRMPKPNPDFQPRFATGYSFAALLNLMANNGMLALDSGIFPPTTKKIKSDLKVLENLGQEIAKKIQGKTPVVYAPVKYRSLAMIWKIMFNENSKTPAFWNFFPELSHNEMVGFTKPQANFYFVMLRDKNDHPQNLKRLEITMNLFKEYGIESVVVDIPEGDPLYRIFATLQIGSFTSYYLALAYEIDPTPVEMVEKLKSLLASS
jgi:glucose/mannose-6-phosphate isomerase